MKIFGLIVMTALFAACGGGGDAELEALAGIYQTTKHTLNEEGCAAEGPEETDMPYFQFLPEELMGQTYLAFGECQSADPASCTSGGIFSAWAKVDGEIRYEIYMTSGGGEYGTCNLSYVRGDLTSLGDTVSLQIRTYREADETLTEEQCDTDEAKARGTSMPCESFEVIEGTRVQ